MSIGIDVEKVIGVLLRDGWHEVVRGSFGIDAYEFLETDEPCGRPRLVLNGESILGQTSTGAAWNEPGGTSIACPFTSILAVRFQGKRWRDR